MEHPVGVGKEGVVVGGVDDALGDGYAGACVAIGVEERCGDGASAPAHVAVGAGVVVVDGLCPDEPCEGGVGDAGHSAAGLGDERVVGFIAGGVVEGVVVEGVGDAEEVVEGGGVESLRGEEGIVESGIGGIAEDFEFEFACFGGVVGGERAVPDVGIERSSLGPDGGEAVEGERAELSGEEGADVVAFGGADGVSGRVDAHLREMVAVLVEVEECGGADLADVGGGGDGLSAAPGGGERGEEDADEYRDDGDDDEELDEGEGVACAAHA